MAFWLPVCIKFPSNSVFERNHKISSYLPNGWWNNLLKGSMKEPNKFHNYETAMFSSFTEPFNCLVSWDLCRRQLCSWCSNDSRVQLWKSVCNCELLLTSVVRKLHLKHLYFWWALVIVIITLHASCGAVYCNQSCLYVCLWVCCGSVTTITRNCVHRSSPNWA